MEIILGREIVLKNLPQTKKEQKKSVRSWWIFCIIWKTPIWQFRQKITKSVRSREAWKRSNPAKRIL